MGNLPKGKGGLLKTPEYKAWSNAKARCTNPKNPKYRHYGGRGITMCAEWLNSFAAFYRDMGPKPPNTTLERIDNDKGYSLENCDWVSRKEQNNNRRFNRRYEFNNEIWTLAQLADLSGVSRTTIKRRIENGMSVDDAVYLKAYERLTD